MRLFGSAEKIYHLLLVKELHELGDINEEEYTALIRTLFLMVTDARMVRQDEEDEEIGN